MQVPAAIGRWTAGCLLVVASLGAAAATPPPPDSMVTDRAGVLSPDVRASLARRLGEYEARSGHQVVVWIDRSSGGVPIETFAVEAFAAWKIGRAGLDDGLAIFAMTEDRALRVEVGYELESRVTDLVASSVIRHTMIPRIERGEWDAAIEQGVEAIVDTIEGHAGSLPAGDGGGDLPETGMWGKIGLGVLAALFLLFLITHPRRAIGLLILLGRTGIAGGLGRAGVGDLGGFRGGGGRSGGGGASGRW